MQTFYALFIYCTSTLQTHYNPSFEVYGGITKKCLYNIGITHMGLNSEKLMINLRKTWV